MIKKNITGILVLAAIFFVFGNTYAQQTAKEVVDRGIEYVKAGQNDQVTTEFTKVIEEEKI